MVLRNSVTTCVTFLFISVFLFHANVNAVGDGGGYNGPTMAGTSIPLHFDKAIPEIRKSIAIDTCIVYGNPKKGIKSILQKLYYIANGEMVDFQNKNCKRMYSSHIPDRSFPKRHEISDGWPTCTHTKYRYFITTKVPTDREHTPALVLKDGKLLEAIWKYGSVSTTKLRIGSLQGTFLEGLDFNSNKNIELSEGQFDFLMSIGGAQDSYRIYNNISFRLIHNQNESISSLLVKLPVTTKDPVTLEKKHSDVTIQIDDFPIVDFKSKVTNSYYGEWGEFLNSEVLLNDLVFMPDSTVGTVSNFETDQKLFFTVNTQEYMECITNELQQ